MPGAFGNILITKPSALGDIVLALPALTALHKSFPDAKISWLVRPEFAPLLENHPHLAKVIAFDRKFLGKAWYHPRAFIALVSLIRRLRRSRFDVAFDFQGLFRTAVLAWLSGCKRRVGMANAREFATIFYTDKIPPDPNNRHLVDYYIRMIRAAGATELGVEFVFPQDADAADSVANLLASHGVAADRYAVLVPGSAQPDKCWPIEHFAILAEKISSQFGLPIIAAGTASESPLIETLKEKARVPVMNLAGRTSLKELIALLRAARLVVSNDTGPGHIAAALGTPLVLMFSWSNPARIAPYGRIECMVANEPYSRGHKIRSSDPEHDIRAITVEQVWQKVCEQLGNLPGHSDRSPVAFRDEAEESGHESKKGKTL
ncbi:MAG TPA: glycosyltransferase family 9 protein [Sedimentisphaerales bacterium]|nr:glycosyltransferase family 9 protein [Sedimentisphaerales bacterium]